MVPSKKVEVNTVCVKGMLHAQMNWIDCAEAAADKTHGNIIATGKLKLQCGGVSGAGDAIGRIACTHDTMGSQGFFDQGYELAVELGDLTVMIEGRRVSLLAFKGFLKSADQGWLLDGQGDMRIHVRGTGIPRIPTFDIPNLQGTAQVFLDESVDSGDLQFSGEARKTTVRVVHVFSYASPVVSTSDDDTASASTGAPAVRVTGTLDFEYPCLAGDIAVAGGGASLAVVTDGLKFPPVAAHLVFHCESPPGSAVLTATAILMKADALNIGGEQLVGPVTISMNGFWESHHEGWFFAGYVDGSASSSSGSSASSSLGAATHLFGAPGLRLGSKLFILDSRAALAVPWNTEPMVVSLLDGDIKINVRLPPTAMGCDAVRGELMAGYATFSSQDGAASASATVNVNGRAQCDNHVEAVRATQEAAGNMTDLMGSPKVMQSLKTAVEALRAGAGRSADNIKNMRNFAAASYDAPEAQGQPKYTLACSSFPAGAHAFLPGFTVRAGGSGTMQLTAVGSAITTFEEQIWAGDVRFIADINASIALPPFPGFPNEPIVTVTAGISSGGQSSGMTAAVVAARVSFTHGMIEFEGEAKAVTGLLAASVNAEEVRQSMCFSGMVGFTTIKRLVVSVPLLDSVTDPLHRISFSTRAEGVVMCAPVNGTVVAIITGQASGSGGNFESLSLTIQHASITVQLHRRAVDAQDGPAQWATGSISGDLGLDPSFSPEGLFATGFVVFDTSRRGGGFVKTPKPTIGNDDERRLPETQVSIKLLSWQNHSESSGVSVSLSAVTGSDGLRTCASDGDGSYAVSGSVNIRLADDCPSSLFEATSKNFPPTTSTPAWTVFKAIGSIGCDLEGAVYNLSLESSQSANIRAKRVQQNARNSTGTFEYACVNLIGQTKAANLTSQYGFRVSGINGSRTIRGHLVGEISVSGTSHEDSVGYLNWRASLLGAVHVDMLARVGLGAPNGGGEFIGFPRALLGLPSDAVEAIATFKLNGAGILSLPRVDVTLRQARYTQGMVGISGLIQGMQYPCVGDVFLTSDSVVVEMARLDGTDFSTVATGGVVSFTCGEHKATDPVMMSYVVTATEPAEINAELGLFSKDLLPTSGETVSTIFGECEEEQEVDMPDGEQFTVCSGEGAPRLLPWGIEGGFEVRGVAYDNVLGLDDGEVGYWRGSLGFAGQAMGDAASSIQFDTGVEGPPQPAHSFDFDFGPVEASLIGGPVLRKRPYKCAKTGGETDTGDVFVEGSVWFKSFPNQKLTLTGTKYCHPDFPDKVWKEIAENETHVGAALGSSPHTSITEPKSSSSLGASYEASQRPSNRHANVHSPYREGHPLVYAVALPLTKLSRAGLGSKPLSGASGLKARSLRIRPGRLQWLLEVKAPEVTIPLGNTSNISLSDVKIQFKGLAVPPILSNDPTHQFQGADQMKGHLLVWNITMLGTLEYRSSLSSRSPSIVPDGFNAGADEGVQLTGILESTYDTFQMAWDSNFQGSFSVEKCTTEKCATEDGKHALNAAASLGDGLYRSRPLQAHEGGPGWRSVRDRALARYQHSGTSFVDPRTGDRYSPDGSIVRTGATSVDADDASKGTGFEELDDEYVETGWEHLDDLDTDYEVEHVSFNRYVHSAALLGRRGGKGSTKSTTRLTSTAASKAARVKRSTQKDYWRLEAAMYATFPCGQDENITVVATYNRQDGSLTITDAVAFYTMPCYGFDHDGYAFYDKGAFWEGEKETLACKESTFGCRTAKASKWDWLRTAEAKGVMEVSMDDDYGSGDYSDLMLKTGDIPLDDPSSFMIKEHEMSLSLKSMKLSSKFELRQVKLHLRIYKYAHMYERKPNELLPYVDTCKGSTGGICGYVNAGAMTGLDFPVFNVPYEAYYKAGLIKPTYRFTMTASVKVSWSIDDEKDKSEQGGVTFGATVYFQLDTKWILCPKMGQPGALLRESEQCKAREDIWSASKDSWGDDLPTIFDDDAEEDGEHIQPSLSISTPDLTDPLGANDPSVRQVQTKTAAWPMQERSIKFILLDLKWESQLYIDPNVVG
jgi:hypothetical protein